MTLCDKAKSLWSSRLTWTTSRRLIFTEIYFCEIFIRLVFAWIYSCGYIFCVAKSSWIVKFLQFCVDFIFLYAKYAFLTCTVPVVEIEGFLAILPKLKSINQYEVKFLYFLFFFKIKTTLTNELNRNLELI